VKKNKLCDLLGIEYPIIQAPMNWVTGAEMASAVSNAGGLGVIGPNAGSKIETYDIFETGERLRQQIRKTKSLTKKPFGVNISSASDDLRPGSKPFSAQCVRVILEEGVPIVVLTGDKPQLFIEKLKEAGIIVLHRALPVNVDIAKEAEQTGIDAFIAVGFEAGGHTGFYHVPTFVLVPQVVDALRIPVIAGGGIADGRGMAAAIVLGAEGVYIGTKFLVAKECPTHENVKQAVIHANDISTTAIEGLNGVVLRALKTPVIERCIKMAANGNSIEEITNYYRSGYYSGMLAGDSENGTFIFGAGAGLIKEKMSAGETIRDIVRETELVLRDIYRKIL
jgi:NAD(P)H-dependent flavin oxidoreductase YrpB (nitropropane dioxygenase family)